MVAIWKTGLRTRTTQVLFAGTTLAACLAAALVSSSFEFAEHPGLEVSISAKRDFDVHEPVLVALVFRNMGETSILLPCGFDILRTKTTVSFDLVSETGVVVGLRRPSALDFESLAEGPFGPLQIDKFTLEPKSSRRVLVDLQNLGLPEDLPSGNYGIKVLIYSSPGRVVLARRGPTLRFVNSAMVENKADKDTAQDKRLFDRRRGVSIDFLAEAMEADQESSVLIERDKRSRWLFYRAWAAAMNGRRPVVSSDWDNSIALPEMKMIRYESLMRDNAQFEANLIRREILDQYPGMTWRFDDLEHGRGFLGRGEALLRIRMRSRRD